MHLVGCTIRIYYDARTYERRIKDLIYYCFGAGVSNIFIRRVTVSRSEVEGTLQLTESNKITRMYGAPICPFFLKYTIKKSPQAFEIIKKKKRKKLLQMQQHTNWLMQD